MTYLKKVLIWIDQGINVILFAGYPDETLSSRAYRLCRDGNKCLIRKIIDTIFFLEKEHCYKSYVSEEENRHLPPKFRE